MWSISPIGSTVRQAQWGDRGLVKPNAHYLITGGAGFIGSNLVAALLDAGASVRVVDDFSSGRRENLEEFAGRFSLLEGCITDMDVCRAACDGVDYVLHQAAVPSVQRSIEDPLRTHHASATAGLNMLIAAKDAGVKRMVLAGSSSAYGDTPELPKKETMAPRPLSPYAVAKLASEQYARVFPDLFGLETVVLRYFNVFGPRQDPNSLYSAVIPLFFNHAMEGRAPIINGDGEQTRDFTYVSNVVQANLKACIADASRAVGQVFNVGCGDRISVNRLWSVISGVVGVDIQAEYRPARLGDVRDSLADLTAIRAGIGYDPTVGLEEGLERTYAWFQQTEGALAPK